MDKVLITGGNGLMGNAFKALPQTKYQLIFVSKEDGNLTVEDDVFKIFSEHRPDYVIHLAARVGGIGRNLNSPAQQFYSNIMMNTLMLEYSHLFRVKKALAFSSACAFPGDLLIQEESKLHAGEPYPAHRAYAYAKRMVDVQIEAYNKQYGTNYTTVIPGNLFGEHDNFNLEDGHVIPSLIHKCYLAKRDNTPFKVWGSGKAHREFIYSGDVARVCLDLLGIESPPRLIVSGDLLSIREIVELICLYFNYYNVEWQTDKPEGQMYRSSDKTLFNSTIKGFRYSYIEESINKTCKWFEDNFETARK